MSRFANAAPPRWLVAAFLCFNFPLSALQPAQERNGFPLHPPDLRSRLLQALADKGSGYEPRTEHLEPNGSPRYTNRLILEQSPYLIQHAHNPVNWYPWSDEAFERARLENKPVFLSIGYSTCHWCHVMERESFDNEEIAELLNEKFICIKVDREQRPDLDEIYMTAVQLLTRHGGWPMSSFLTPDRDPFFGGTYFPPQQFVALLGRIDEAWQKQRQQLVDQSLRVSAAVRDAVAARGQAREIGEEAIASSVSEILSRQDPQLGGVRGAPKFPHEPELLFLIDVAQRTMDSSVVEAIEKSLDHMARGGIYDQVGGGFHRYSTDAEWLVPHFEKMLYNQAHLSRAYVGAARLTGEPFYERVGRQILDYVLREMQTPEGGFYSATDADSEGEEGLFFLWSRDELRAALDPQQADLAIELYGTEAAGNFEGSNILHLPKPLASFAASSGRPLAELLGDVDAIRERLWQIREGREHPLRDDKVLLAWNGMMITALASASSDLDDEGYREAAVRAAEFLWRTCRRGEGRFWRIYLDGAVSTPAMQEDHAYFAEALLALYDTTGDEVWLERTREVTQGMIEQFWDAEAGGFFLTSTEIDDDLIALPKSPADGAIPSGNSVALTVLSKLAARTGESAYKERGEQLLAAFSSNILQAPAAFAYMLRAADELLHGGVGPLQFSSSGHLRAHGRASTAGDGEARLILELEIADGWHINSAEPLQEELVPLELATGPGGSWELVSLDLPEPREVRLGFQDEPLSVYEGRVRIEGRLRRSGDDTRFAIAPIELRLQACNDELCLRPETVTLQVPIPRTEND